MTRLEDKHIPIEAVKINGRFRKDLGDLEELKASIVEVGLLQPIVVTPDSTLVCGARRLEALRRLDWDSVPVTIMDNPTEALRLEAERDENTCRLDMKPSEMVALTDVLLEVERVAAKARMDAGRERALEVREARRRGEEVMATGSSGTRRPSAREIAAAAAGFSARTYDQAAEVCRRAAAGEETAQEALAEMDRTGRVQTAWRKLNGVPPRALKPVEVETEHQHVRAEARKARVAKAIYGFEGFTTAMEKVDLRYVLAVASPEELGEWDRILGEAVTTLRKLRSDLKTEGSVA